MPPQFLYKNDETFDIIILISKIIIKGAIGVHLNREQLKLAENGAMGHALIR